MRQKIVLSLLCFAMPCLAAAQNQTSQSSNAATTEIPSFRTAEPQLSLALTEKLFGDGRTNFSATTQALPTQPKQKLTTCYAMRSYNFDNSDVPQMTGQTTCTDSQLASKKYADDEKRLGRSTVILLQGR